MKNTEHLTGVAINLNAYVDEYPDRALNAFRNSSRYTVEELDRCVIKNLVDTDDGQQMISGGFFSPETPKFVLHIADIEQEGEEVAYLRELLGESDFDSLTVPVYSYYRRLPVDEGTVEEFVNELVTEIEALGYSVDTERSSGMYVFFDDDANEDTGPETTQEYKWWFYIREDDDENSMSPHSLNLLFEEDGIYMSGHVMEGKENADSFRNLLTTFTGA